MHTATSLEFSFTDGSNWDGPYNLIMDLPDKLKGLPQSYFNEVRLLTIKTVVNTDPDNVYELSNMNTRLTVCTLNVLNVYRCVDMVLSQTVL